MSVENTKRRKLVDIQHTSHEAFDALILKVKNTQIDSDQFFFFFGRNIE